MERNDMPVQPVTNTRGTHLDSSPAGTAVNCGIRCKIPSPRRNYIIRKKLTERLDMMKDYPVTIIKGGAGSGKTTLLSVYIKERNLKNVSWITFDDSMNQVFLFWNYMFGSLESVLGEDAEGLRSCFGSSIQKEMLEQVLYAFADRLGRGEDIFLVLDDFQWIRDGYLLETLNMFLKMMPQNLHLVFLSRTMPGIHTGTLYMEGKLLTVSEEEMRLSREECREFLEHTLGLQDTGLGDQKIENIIDHANGWIGGAQLMAVTGRMSGTERAVFTAADESVIFDYMEKEIFSSLSDEEQQFLMKTAVPGYFNEEFCSRYLPEYHFTYMVKRISDKNLFIILIDEEKAEYRYHAILREFLLHMLEGDAEKKSQLYLKAADVMYDLSDYDECVRLLFESREYRVLMERLLKMPQNSATFSYMMKVPMEQIIINPNFAYQYFFCYYAALEVEECGKIYDYITRHLRKDSTYQAFEHADLFFNVNWEFSNITILTAGQINSMPLNQVSKAYLLLKEAYFLFLGEQVPEAMSYLKQAEQIYRKTGNIYIEQFVLAEKTQILEEYGSFTEALRMYGRMKEIIRNVPSMESSYYIGIAGLHIRQLRLSEAWEELELAGQSVCSEADSVYSAYLYTLAEWYYITGMPEKTVEIITNLADGDIYQSVFFSARLLRYPIYRGKNLELAKRFQENYKDSEEILKKMDTELLYIGIEYETGDKDKALDMAETLTAKARKLGNRTKIIEGSLMKARFLYEQRISPVSVVNLLIEATEYACPEKIRLPFWFEKTFLRELIREKEPEIRKVMPAIQQDFLWDIIFHEETEKQEEKQTLPYDLTVREMEVLEEIAVGNTNKVIADHLCISLSTVKTHLISIYGKLGVNNRLAASNKIRNLRK